MRLIAAVLGYLVAVGTVARAAGPITLAELESRLSALREDDAPGFQDPDKGKTSCTENCAQKLVSIDDKDGNMYLNKAMKFDIERTGVPGYDSEPIYIAAVFGKVKTGKSLTATMLSCALAATCDHCYKRSTVDQVIKTAQKPGGCHRRKETDPCVNTANDLPCSDVAGDINGLVSEFRECKPKADGRKPAHFDSSVHNPVSSINDKSGHTSGLWTSHYITHRNKKFLLFDMEGLEHKNMVKARRDAVDKMVAMLSEVASIFILTATHEGADLDIVGKAMTATREHLLVQTVAEEMSQPPLKSHNKPSLVVFLQSRDVKTARMPKNEDCVESDTDKNCDCGLGHTENFMASDMYTRLGDNDANYQDMLSDNFRLTALTAPKSTQESAGTGNIPWTVVYQPILKNGGAKWCWGNIDPYDWQMSKPFPHGEGCSYYENMTHKAFIDTPVEIYAESMRTLADIIETKGVAREVSWGGAKGDPLTSKMLWEYLNDGIAEMNKVKPLPDDEMWRLILSDGCAHTCETYVNTTLGWADGGVLNEYQKVVDKNIPGDADSLPATIQEQWQVKETMTKKELKDLYAQTFPAAEEMCEEKVTRWIEKLSSEKDHLISVANLQAKEHQLKEVQRQLDEKFYEDNKLYLTIWLVAGSIIAIVMMRMFRQINMTCREALGCCGDCFGSKKTQRRVVRYDAETGSYELGKATTTQVGAGAQLTGALTGAVTGTAGAAAGALTGGLSYTDAELRITNLEKMIAIMYTERDGASAASH